MSAISSFASATGAVLVLATLGGCAEQNPAAPTVLIGGRGTASARNWSAATVTDSTQARAPIAFTLTGCTNLPAGLTVFGSGDDFLVINSRVDADGVSYLERNDLVTGTATDSNGAGYKFSYHNHSNITVPAGGFPWSFTTTDHFNLVGNGRADQMQVHFVARVTFPSPSDPPLIEFVNSRGNPFFCDPI
jgi:hypothetical protein